MRHLYTLCVLGSLAAAAAGQSSFVNWETPPVHPLAQTADGSRLLVVNTADNRLEVFAVGAGGLNHMGAIPVGLDPVSVRPRTSSEVWVVNQLSDSISIIDLGTMNVVSTLTTGDEPADVVFAGTPPRAFVSISQLNQVWVYDPENLDLAPMVIDIEGEDPRALATDGSTVYAAIFESGNWTTILGQQVVSSSVNPYPGDQNPPPNSGTGFVPPMTGGLPTPPDVSLILKRQESGDWLDDNGGNWSSAVTWDLHDHDVAVIDADTLAVSYVNGLMNANMGLAVNGAGSVTVVGTDAINEIRFEPNLNGIFLRVMAATFPAGGGSPAIVDLNPHLDYSTAALPQAQRDQSIGDPRAVAWNQESTQAYVAGMGSNNVAVVDAALQRIAEIEVGQGPCGLVVDEGHDRVYVLNRFEASVSIIDQNSLIEQDRIAFYDPTPQVIRDGRPHLYDTHATSGLGHVSCASCHIDARMDQLAWDLGDPSGEVKDFNQSCNGGIPFGGQCEDWHPMKGPMATQTLVGIVGDEPFHWRGDREDVPAFNGAFEGLLGDDQQLSTEEMSQLVAYIETLTTPPNPFRNFDSSLPTTFPNGGNPDNGSFLYNNVGLDGGLVTCEQCHALPTGANGFVVSGNLLQETQSLKVPQLRNMHEKTGFDHSSTSNNRGFGFIHDGSTDTMFEFLQFSGFTFSNDQQRRDVEAFLMCFGTDTEAAVGVQTTVENGPSAPAAQLDLIDDMLALADTAAVGVVVKGLQGGVQRGYSYTGGDQFQSDRESEVVTSDALLAGAAAGAELTFTVVPFGSQTRIGIDRDEDGALDRDELDAGSDPADPQSLPGDPVCRDLNGDVVVDAADLAVLLGAWGANPGHAADYNNDTTVDAADLAALLGAWGPCP